jgi:hypothetical protein
MIRRVKRPRPKSTLRLLSDYLSQEIFNEVDDACDKILAQIVKMIDQADRWVIKPRPDPPAREEAATSPSERSNRPIPEQAVASRRRRHADTPTRRSVSPGESSRA